MKSKKNQKTKLVLASNSAIRKKLLLQAGINVTVQPSDVDECALKKAAQGKEAGDMSALLATAKAQAVTVNQDQLVIGADQILEFENQQFDKVATLGETRARLALLSGKTHYLVGTTVLVQQGKVIWEHKSRAKMVMHDLDKKEIEAYLYRAGKQVLASVGCYEIEGLGVRLFERIEGDYFSILGLSLLPLCKELRRLKAVTI